MLPTLDRAIDAMDPRQWAPMGTDAVTAIDVIDHAVDTRRSRTPNRLQRVVRSRAVCFTTMSMQAGSASSETVEQVLCQPTTAHPAAIIPAFGAWLTNCC